MAANVIDCPAETEAIVSAWQRATSESFAAGIGNMTNPYGDGTASERMCEFLLRHSDRGKLLDKRALPLTEGETMTAFTQHVS